MCIIWRKCLNAPANAYDTRLYLLHLTYNYYIYLLHLFLFYLKQNSYFYVIFE